ncbi:MAG TPA: metalloregulator ArsR/SmtB family transcription factor [Polyangiaceae bacterium]|nr:metalloregulator ArsR/SmtB family transcription factor [Polyangiaceae bacterium]
MYAVPRSGSLNAARSRRETTRARRDTHCPDVFRAIADPTRRAILDRLRGGPAPVNALASDFAQSRPAISKHLRVLREARLVTEERAGRERVYQLSPRPLQTVAGWVEGYRSFWLDSLNNLKRMLEAEEPNR